MGKSLDSTCRLCGEDEETPYHLIHDCGCTMREMTELAAAAQERKLSLEDQL
ncbi:Uncharacterized protein FKW44_018490 [Caligus rogercresseyi]|uniref:Uncharacterized protein n=1 Tax=Caligus rogercresseyi TaxID=217165 RepID=A0A7T8JXR1_CALRO|nr:Uncharacterized protein FKW44_018490 [Caligus rogercresseyi]